MVFSTHTATQHALAEYLKMPQTYESLPAFYQEKRDAFRQLMAQTRFRLFPARAAIFS
jgi:methionine aminotransferase